MQYDKLKKVAVILLIIFLVALILFHGQSFLIPLAFAGLLAALLLPIQKWLEGKGLARALSVLLAMLVLVACIAGLFTVLSWQISDLAKDKSRIEQQAKKQYQKLQQFVSETLNISPEEHKKIIEEQKSSAPGKATGLVSGILTGLGAFLTDLILTLVYIFLLLYMRNHLKRFVIRIVPAPDENTARTVMHGAQKVTQQYLTGLAMMIGVLWIMYGIGFSIAGVKNAIFFAILCGVLEIIPFIGNIIGTSLTLGVAMIQGADTNVLVGILITYGLVQFVQTYILEPLVVGAEVNLNPLFTILALVVGEMVWGIPGMILAIPLMGVTKIICDHVEPLRPYGELIGEERKNKKESAFKRKIKEAGSRIKGLFD
jgi:predicted PurR-regulated permease PerM